MDFVITAVFHNIVDLSADFEVETKKLILRFDVFRRNIFFFSF